jgi:TolB-like protein/DNA-binding winged helix-turn-helix (wHTH) protein/Tfp pilus assembly protein PilF
LTTAKWYTPAPVGATMDTPVQPSEVLRFANFEVDPWCGEIRRDGRKVRLPHQPFRILLLLLESPGKLVTREELRLKLWPADTFVDFDHGLNNAINRIREALGDSAESPRFIETVPRKGYRFICPVKAPAADTPAAIPARSWGLAGRLSLVFLPVVVALVAWVVLHNRQEQAAAHPPISSIAVLPLNNLSGDKEQEYFADGMTDAIITELGRFGTLRVISLQSVLRYKGSDKPLPEIARELKVEAVVEGSVLRSGDHLRINAQLVQAAPEKHLWSNGFDGDASDVLRLQSDVAAGVARAARVAATPEQEKLLAHRREIDPKVYQAYLRGRQMYNRFDDKWFDPATEYLQQAIQLDPNFAPAYATLAEVYCSDMRSSYQDLHSQAEEAAAKAVSLDDNLAEAHAAQALVDLRFRWDWQRAEREIKRAIELNPNSSEAFQTYGYYLTLMGRFDEAIATYRHAVELDPVNFLPNERLGFAYYKARRNDEAIRHFQELSRLEPEMWMVHYSLAHAYAYKGEYPLALEEARKVNCKFDCGWILAMSGRRAEAEQLIRQMTDYLSGRNNVAWIGGWVAQDETASPAKDRHPYLDPCWLAYTYAGLGEKEKALQWLERGYQQRSRLMIYLKIMKELDPLRADPRFQALMRRMNFPK